MPEVLFNPPLLERHPGVAAELKAAGTFDTLQGLQHVVNECINK